MAAKIQPIVERRGGSIESEIAMDNLPSVVAEMAEEILGRKEDLTWTETVLRGNHTTVEISDACAFLHYFRHTEESEFNDKIGKTISEMFAVDPRDIAIIFQHFRNWSLRWHDHYISADGTITFRFVEE